jgi:hypothetical protein
MLGDKAVAAISSLNEITKLFLEFAMEMRGKSANVQSERFGQPVGDGDVMELGIETYRHMNQSLSDRATKLLGVLKKRQKDS